MKQNNGEQIVPFTHELLHSVHPSERKLLLIRYHNWLRKQRKQEIKEDTNLQNRVSRFKNKTKRWNLCVRKVADGIYYHFTLVQSKSGYRIYEGFYDESNFRIRRKIK